MARLFVYDLTNLGSIIMVVDAPMYEKAVDVIPRLLKARNVLEEDLENHVLMLKEKDEMVKKLRKYLVVACVMVFVVDK
nr:zinc finger, GRF-type [Tanacetum cinerariifolium]